MIVFKKYNNKYQNQVLELLQNNFPENKTTKESFIWKHFDDFFKNETVSMIALNGNEVCSFVCFTPIIIKSLKGKLEKFYTCAVQVTDLKYRRQGLVSKLTQMIEGRIDNGSYIGFSNKSGILIDKYSKKINYKILGQFYSDYFFSFPSKETFKVKIKKDLIVKENNFKYNLILKNKYYLNWRYNKNPKKNFLFLSILRDNEEIALVICLKNKFSFNIVDIIVFDESKTIFYKIIKTLSNYCFKQRKLFFTFTFLNNNFWENNLPLKLFRKKREIYFTVKTTKKDFLDLDTWLIQGGDII